mgnify:CR=1 FL=1
MTNMVFETSDWEALLERLGGSKKGVQAIKDLILNLATSGAFETHVEGDVSADILLTNSIDAKLNSKMIGKNPVEYTIKSDEVISNLPNNWTSFRLGSITTYNKRPRVDPMQVPKNTWQLDLEDIEKRSSKILRRMTAGEKGSSSTKTSFLKGDVLYGKLRPNLDKVVVADSSGICSSEIVPISVHGETRPEWIRILLKRPYFLKAVSKLTHGVSLPRLKTKDALNTIHPLPPVVEQDCIIEIVDRLFDLCDNLSDALDQREKNTEQFIQQIPEIKWRD